MKYCWVNVYGVRKLHVCPEDYGPQREAFPFCGTRVDIRYLEYETTVPPWVGPEDICKKCKKHIDARTERMASEKNECNCEQSLLLKEQLDYACKQYSNLLGQHVELEKWFMRQYDVSRKLYEEAEKQFERLESPLDIEKKAETEVNDG